MAETAKNEGNAALKTGDMDKAIDCYTRAIELDSSNHVFFSNRSMVYSKTGSFAAALADANRVTELKPAWAKGYARLGDAFTGLGDKAKADIAYAKWRELGGSSAGARSSAGTARPAAAAAATSGGPSLDLLSKLRLGLRVFVVLNFVLFLLPPTSSYGAFQRTLFAAAGSHVLQLYATHGPPSRAPEYLQKAAMDWRSHYAMSAILFAFGGSPRFLLLVPHVLLDVGFVAEYLLSHQPQLAARLAGPLETHVLPRMANASPQEWAAMAAGTKWQRYNAAVLHYAASVEVGIALTLVVELFTPSRNVLVTFAYWHFLRVRYMTSPEIKTVFAALDAKLLGLLASFPPGLNVYQKLRGFMAARVAMPTPGAPPPGQGFMDKLSANCVIS